jgi:decaprenyl-phosphate phosphoribosyltransferase
LPLHSTVKIDSLAATSSEELTQLQDASRPRPEVLIGGREDAPRSRRGSVGALIRACRPRQWTKNLLVLAAPLAAGAIDWPGVPARVAGAFVALCMVSSATYLFNDVRDREQDRVHPRKRTRPIAAGELSIRAAITAGAVLALGGLALAAAITPGLAAVGAGYLAVTMSYSLWWRRIVVADILAIAAGFVLRALAGGVATDIYLSRWFVIVTACGAIFLVAAKRYAELHERVAPRLERATLRHYSLRGLRVTLAAAATLASIAYISWAFTRPSHLLWYALSIIPFLLWLARYASLAGAGAAQAPEELILRDRTLLALSLVWGLLFLGGVYVGH